eukprot:2262022-Pleurochrysis_carterae.AAC.2
MSEVRRQHASARSRRVRAREGGACVGCGCARPRVRKSVRARARVRERISGCDCVHAFFACAPNETAQTKATLSEPRFVNKPYELSSTSDT